MSVPAPHNEILLDFQRRERLGLEEAILCPGKTREHLLQIFAAADEVGRPLLLTRLDAAQLAALPDDARARIDYEPLSRTGYYGPVPEPTAPPRVAIVAAGTSDAFVTREIERTLRYYGHASSSFIDVGLAGMWRLMSKLEAIQRHPVVIVVAGMDAALPTAVGGLVSGVVIAVPTSTGYGVASGGRAALGAILSSCSPGLLTLNIDNGYGAACAAARVLRVMDGSSARP